jgi:NAD(P)-dependent dehydrogenase (short-subunit alcohol dehydrogenase family)
MSGILNPEVLVLGAGGTVGFGVVGALLEAGSPVLAVGRDGSRMQALAEHFAGEPGLELMTSGCVVTDADAAALVSRLRKRKRPLRAVFASLATPLEGGRLLDKPTDFLRQKLESDLVPHLAAARHLIPLLGEQEGTSHYILLGGPHAECGWAGYGHASITSAALRMLTHVLHEEATGLGVRVQMLAVDKPVSTPGNVRNACAEWPSALAVGRHAVSLLTRTERQRAVVPFDAGRALMPPRALFDEFSLPLSTHETNP